ncbi:MAG: phage tail protein [Spirochaetales bacterium]|jgi:phage tail-like protein|nr:phage tail protein [Spirochaetales bacterium]
MANERRITPYLFTVEIDGIEAARFQNCEGLEAETTVIEVEEGGLNSASHKFYGAGRYPNLILEKGVTENETLFTWYKETVLEDKRTERKNGSVILRDAANSEVKRWNFFRGFPCRWSGPRLEAGAGGGVAIERLEIAHEGLIPDGN